MINKKIIIIIEKLFYLIILFKIDLKLYLFKIIA